MLGIRFAACAFAVEVSDITTLLKQRDNDIGGQDAIGCVGDKRLDECVVGVPRRAIHQISWIREPHAGRLRDVDFTTTSLYAALADVGVTVARASETIRPEVLRADVARYLDEDEGAPVLVSDRITYGPDGTALVADRATILGSMMQITADRAPTGLSLHWGATPSL